MVSAPSSRTIDGAGAIGMSDAQSSIGVGDWVLLDPSVELLAGEHSGSRILCHRELEMGLSVPPGEGLVEFITSLIGAGISEASLRDGFDDRALVEELLSSLRRHGFLLVAQSLPSGEELASLRLAARRRRIDAARPALVFDLDKEAPLEVIRDQLPDRRAPADLLLWCVKLADHGAAFARLAELRNQGLLQLHHTVVRTRDVVCDIGTRRALLQLSASIVLEGVAWPQPDRDIAGLAEMTRDHIPVHAQMRPGKSFLLDSDRARAASWARSAYLSGLRLLLDPGELWSQHDAGEDDFAQLFDLVHAFSQEFCDVHIANLPADEILVGAAQPRSLSAGRSPLQDRFRAAYLRWRLAMIKGFESGFTWSQLPEAEEKFVRLGDDLLPNRPELLKLRPGSILLDVCGGLGRVARRLAPAVGTEGLVISIEMDRCLVDRARGFAAAMKMANVQFRVGVAQRIPLPDATVDAAVNEWTGAIWELGLGSTMIGEMARVVRPGGRIAVTHRLVQIPLTQLDKPWVQYDEIYNWVRSAFECEGLRVLTEHVWGQIVPSLVGENATAWREQMLPSVLDPYDFVYDHERDPGPRADVYLTVVAERVDCATP